MAFTVRRLVCVPLTLNSFTQPPLELFRAHRVNAVTGDTVKTVPVKADGSYSATMSSVGTFYVVAGQDEISDGRI